MTEQPRKPRVFLPGDTIPAKTYFLKANGLVERWRGDVEVGTHPFVMDAVVEVILPDHETLIAEARSRTAREEAYVAGFMEARYFYGTVDQDRSHGAECRKSSASEAAHCTCDPVSELNRAWAKARVDEDLRFFLDGES